MLQSQLTPRMKAENHFMKSVRIAIEWNYGPVKCHLDGGSVMTDEEVMLRGLYELVSGEDQHNISANVFGREQTAQSRAFKFFINHIYYSFYDLLTDNLEWWRDNGFLEESNAAITAKLRELGIDIDDIFAFIDCNCMEIQRVGGGPRQGGADADRWVSNVQRAFYNGWKSIHGLKHQSVVIAHGFTIDLYGPTSVRRNDLKLLADSHINARLFRLFGERWKMYGDSIYPRLSNLTSSWRCKPKTPRMKAENHFMKSVRIAIEWNYGPVKCHLDGGSVMTDEEVMLRGLYELVSGEDQHNISANVFGREQTAQSRAFKFFINHIYYSFYDLLTVNLEWWHDNGFLEESNAAITAKLRELGIDIDDIFAFIDCNCMEIQRVGGGPRQGGADADRWVSNVQRAFYNGWKSIHGLKHQSVVIAHGFTIDLYGPTSVRRNDLKLLADSHINARLFLFRFFLFFVH